MITGEYFILDGALSLSLPTKYGQSLEIYDNLKNEIKWEAYNYKNEKWLEAVFDNELKLKSKSNREVIFFRKDITRSYYFKPFS